LEAGHARSERFPVLAPDLLGHGESDKTKGDYSLGAVASTLRDLIVALGYKRATVVGQSYGGGIVMQFAYQYPERCERLVLVDAGGLGSEVNPLLRMLTLPGSEAVLLVACAPPVPRVVETIGRVVLRKKLENAAVIPELWRSYASLGDVEALTEFIESTRPARIKVSRKRILGPP
jgi:pimeloyl-ACP methyl ester carboxylesterase